MALAFVAPLLAKKEKFSNQMKYVLKRELRLKFNTESFQKQHKRKIHKRKLSIFAESLPPQKKTKQCRDFLLKTLFKKKVHCQNIHR